MDLENFTPFTPAVYASGKEGSRWTATVMVKGLFLMRNGECVVPAAKQLFPMGDCFAEGADPLRDALLYPSDFVPRKVSGEVLLNAIAHRPKDRATGTFYVSFRVGRLEKKLAVSGRREFKSGVLSRAIVEREPLDVIPIVYQNAFGGQKSPTNPVGRGLDSDELPLIEDAQQRVQQPSDRPLPAGFGPLSTAWEPRKSLVGTFGRDYLEKSWPAMPDDFDPHYYHAAPSDQQYAGYFVGNEEIVLENLHPIIPRYTTWLPGWRVISTREDRDGNAVQIPLVMDTMVIDPTLEQIVVIWRGQMTVQAPDMPEVKRLGFLMEMHTRPASSAAEYVAQLQKFIAERDVEFQPETPPPISRSKESPEAEPEAETAEMAAAEAKLRDSLLEVAKIRARFGLPPVDDPSNAPPPPTDVPPGFEKQYREALAQMEEGNQDDLDPPPWTRERVLESAATGATFVGADLSRLDLSLTQLRGVDFRGAKLDDVNFSKTDLTGTNFSSCSMARVQLVDANLSEANLTRANLRNAIAQRAIFAKATMTRTDLTAALLTQANLTSVHAELAILDKATLVEADASQSVWKKAVITSVDASRARFTKAGLQDANCEAANFEGAQMHHADLSQANFTNARLVTADLSHSVAVATDFSSADLTDTLFRFAKCDGMWLSQAKADRADFSDASCNELQVDGTVARKAKFVRCCIDSFRGGEDADLSDADFSHVHGAAPIFEGCKLDRALFIHADIAGANFINASLVETSFNGADLSGARFDYAQAQSASFQGANLLQAILAGTDLRDADLGGSNCFEAEFLDARIRDLRFHECNLTRTKLEAWAEKNRR